MPQPTIAAIITLLDKLQLCREVVAVGEDELAEADKAITRAQQRRADIANHLEIERDRVKAAEQELSRAIVDRTEPRHWFEVVEEG